jgi:hypothetical protein
MGFNPFRAVIAIGIISMSYAHGYSDKALPELFIKSIGKRRKYSTS